MAWPATSNSRPGYPIASEAGRPKLHDREHTEESQSTVKQTGV